jgi:hypothetical protein
MESFLFLNNQIIKILFTFDIFFIKTQRHLPNSTGIKSGRFLQNIQEDGGY